MEEREKQEELKLGKGSQIVIGLFSLLFMAMFLLWASTAPGEGLFNYTPAIFCGFVAGACLLPQPIKGYCGDIIAFVVILIVIWFMYVALPNPEPGADPIMFALIFGGTATAYLTRRYKHVFIKSNT